ncbi:MAG: hypothetical protein E7176_00220 [Erysipelotrichaceae bacterium]|nr:hypothetical protein [Erysipelotrichaceae bacterium]
MRKYIIIALILLRSILIFIAIGAVTTATVKNIYKVALVEQFKNKGVYQEELSTEKVKFYKIDSNEELPAYIKSYNQIIPGAPGDILVSREAIVHPVVNGFISFFAGGHAAICLDEYTDFDINATLADSIEATGLEPGDNLSKVFNRAYWGNNSVYDEVIGLRVKMTEDERKEVISAGCGLIGDPYNFSFIFDLKNKSYCSDIVSKAYSKIGVNLNKDEFSTSIYDLIISSDTYISYYHIFDSNGVQHIYYLG